MNITRYTISKFWEKLRIKYYRRVCKHMGSRVEIYQGFRVKKPEFLSIGENVAINNDVWINAVGGVTIGTNTIIGPKVVIHSSNHNFDRIDIPIQAHGHTSKRVVIEEDVWIGALAVILPGVKISKGAVIGAGAVVTKNVDPYDVVVGVPAKKIRNRLNKDKCI
jgi:acetyltransferase-like isoleucine patch superfamily enzyme